jgi:hypothetical protein
MGDGTVRILRGYTSKGLFCRLIGERMQERDGTIELPMCSGAGWLCSSCANENVGNRNAKMSTSRIVSNSVNFQ